MINKNNELPSFVNETNLPKIVDKLTDASNIKISNNKYGNRVQTVIDKIVEKADDVTKAIKQEVVNDSYSFKVGTGDVDVSADVQDGFGEIGIKGVAYQNLWFGTVDGANITNRVYSPPEYRGECSANSDCGFTIDTDMIKPNVDYTVVFDVKCEVVGILPKVMLFDKGTLSNPKSFNLTNIDATTFKTIVLKIRTDKNGCKILVGFNAGGQEVKGAQMVVKNIIILEGDHTNNPNLPSYFEGIVEVGDKSKNLLNPNSFKSSTGISMIENQVINIDVPTDGGQRTIFEGLNLPAGTYRVTTKVLEGEYTGGNLLFYDSNGEKFTENRLIGSYTINATNNNINKLLIWAVKGICKIRIQLEKGSSETPYEPYYDGHKIEILSCGKNLINWNKNNGITSYTHEGVTFSYNSFTQEFMVNGTATADINYRAVLYTEGEFVKFYKNKKYSFLTNKPLPFYIQISEKNVVSQSTLNPNKTSAQVINLDNKCNYLMIWGINKGDKFENLKFNLYLEEIPVSASYEPYQEDKTQILLDEPLMRLPNGVCDEITRDGKLIRRVGKVVLDGSENWSSGGYTNADRQELYLSPDKLIPNGKQRGPSGYSYNNYISDKFPTIQGIIVVSNKWLALNGAGGITLALPKAELTEPYFNKAKQWLSQNPTIVYYELSTPIITELPAPYLRIFKDGHLTFNTLVAPESNHVVQLNKSAQIERSIREVQSLDNRINVLENNYDNLMLSTISRLNNLELDYTLK